MKHPWIICGLRWRAWSLIAVVLVVGPQKAWADAQVTGNCGVDKVKGRPGDYVCFYEWNVYSSIDGGTSAGSYFRVGLPPSPTRSYYSLTLVPGTHSLMLDEPIWWGRPAVVPNLKVPQAGSLSFDMQPPTDYSCSFDDKAGPWGVNPWTVYDTTWYQTFVATGNSITGVEFKLAGFNATDMRVEIVADPGNGSLITNWPVVGVTRLKYALGTGDQWLRYRSGQIPTTPGNRYALKLTGINGDYAIWRRIDGGTGFADGQAYNSAGVVQNFDIYAVVFSDNDGTLISYANMAANDGGSLLGAAPSWSQEIQAMGSSLAGVSLYIGDDRRQLTFKVHSGSPTGPEIGPAKTGTSGPQASASIATVSWDPGEAPLTAGEKYYIEAAGGANPCNPYRLTITESAYPDGDAFIGLTRLSGVDLYMQVVEWAAVVPPPIIGGAPATISHTIPRRGSQGDEDVSVANIGKGVLNYSISTDVPWLAVDTPSGAAGVETDTVTVSYSTYALTTGVHVGHITISAEQSGVAAKIVPITMSVTAPPFAFCDFDQDGDVDAEDFGRFQVCMTGSGAPQADPLCAGALLDDDNDVDQPDTLRFLNCLSGAGVTVDTTCSDW